MLQKNLNKLKKAQRELSQINGEMPSIFQLSDYLNLTVDEIGFDVKHVSQPPGNQDWREP